MNTFTTQYFVVVAALLLLLVLLLLRTRQIVSSCFVEFVHFVLLPLLCYAMPCFVRCSRLLASLAHFKLPVVFDTSPLFISSALSTQWLRCSLSIHSLVLAAVRWHSHLLSPSLLLSFWFGVPLCSSASIALVWRFLFWYFCWHRLIRVKKKKQCCQAVLGGLSGGAHLAPVAKCQMRVCVCVCLSVCVYVYVRLCRLTRLCGEKYS